MIGELSRNLPPLAKLPLMDLRLIGQLASGALAVAAIGLVEAMSIARSIASQSGQRLDSNQEFVGQGLANAAVGIFSGYPGSGSFTRSAVNFDSGAKTPLASAFSGIFVLVAMLVFAPWAAYVPRAALSGVLILTAYSIVDRREIVRIWRGARADAVIMVVTFLGTLFLRLEFAVLIGILSSFAVYIMKTSVPEVTPVVPDESFRHFTSQPDRPPCSQLAILDIFGDLYSGAVSHVEKAIDQHLAAKPEQRVLLLRMHSVDQCGFSGMHALESIVRSFRDQGGDVFLVKVHDSILNLTQSTDFYDYIGTDHFLTEEEAIPSLFTKILDPAICIYECDVRTLRECQNLPKQTYAAEIPCHTEIPVGSVAGISPRELWEQLCAGSAPLIIDVREPREFEEGHIPQGKLMPLPTLLLESSQLPQDRPVVFVCRGGRRSTRAAFALREMGCDNLAVLGAACWPGRQPTCWRLSTNVRSECAWTYTERQEVVVGMDQYPPRNLGLDLVRVTEAAALRAGRWMGLGRPDRADEDATQAMVEALNTLDMDGHIVIGEEGKLGRHSSLDSGHRVGTGHGPEMDVVVDPIEGRNLLALGRPDAIAVAGIAPHGSMWSPVPAVYMEKVVVSPEVAGALVPECMGAPAAWTIALVARAKKKAVRDLVVFVLDRPRHLRLIEEIRAAGARAMLRSDGDVLGALIAATSDSGTDLLMGIGGVPEGVIAACAVKAMGGGMLGRLAPQSDEERAAVQGAGLETKQILTCHQVVSSNEIFFAATAITRGALLAGVRYHGNKAKTESLVIRAETGTRRIIHAEHLIELKNEPVRAAR